MMSLIALTVCAGLGDAQPCEVQANVPRSQVQNGRVVTDTVKVPVSKAESPPPPPVALTWELWHYSDGSVRWTLVQRTAPLVESYPVPYRYQPMPARVQPSFAAQIQVGRFQAGACYGST